MKTSTKILLGLGLVFASFAWYCNSSSKENEAEYEELQAKLEIEESTERQRIESIISEVNSLASNKDFDNALVKASSISWSVNPSYYYQNVEHYEKQKKEIIETINLLKANSDSVFAAESAQKARQEQSQQNLILLKQQEKNLSKQFSDSLKKINSK